jgi:hypothetical protein
MTAPTPPAEPPKFNGVFMPQQGQLQVQLSFDAATGQMSAVPTGVRIEIWLEWLAIAQAEKNAARAARDTNPGFGHNPAFGEHLTAETRHAMTSICAAAFAVEAFANSVAQMLPEIVPTDYRWSKPKGGLRRFWLAFRRANAAARPRGRAVMTRDLLGRAFRMTNAVSKSMKTAFTEAFAARNQAAHSPANFVNPMMRDEYAIATHPSFVWNRAENAQILLGSVWGTIEALLATPKYPKNTDWVDWCSGMLALSEKTRLSGLVSPTTKPKRGARPRVSASGLRRRAQSKRQPLPRRIRERRHISPKP